AGDSATAIYAFTARIHSTAFSAKQWQKPETVETTRTSAEDNRPAAAWRRFGRGRLRSRRNLLGGCASHRVEHLVSFSACGRKYADDSACARRRIMCEKLCFAGSPLPEK